MRASVALATQAPLLFVVLIVGITSAEEAVGPPNQEATLESTLYGIFDAQELLEKHVSCFDETPLHTNVVTNINVSPSGDDFKLFRIGGKISDEGLEDLMQMLQTELTDPAGTSGVKLTGKPKTTVGDRPIQLLVYLASWSNC